MVIMGAPHAGFACGAFCMWGQVCPWAWKDATVWEDCTSLRSVATGDTSVGNRRCPQSFVEVLSRMRQRYGFGLVGYVVMPDHAHLLIYEGDKGAPSDVLKALKQCVSRDLRNPEGAREKASRSRSGEQSCRNFGKPGSMTSMSIPTRRRRRNCFTCMQTLWHEGW